MAASFQRRVTAKAIAAQRAYSPMPYFPETGTNTMLGALVKGGEPAIQHQEVPGSAKFAAHRSLQHAALHEAPHCLSKQLRPRFEPAMHGQAEAGFRAVQISGRQSRLHQAADQ